MKAIPGHMKPRGRAWVRESMFLSLTSPAAGLNRLISEGPECDGPELLSRFAIYQLLAENTPENTQCARHGPETGAALLSLSHCVCPHTLQPLQPPLLIAQPQRG